MVKWNAREGRVGGGGSDRRPAAGRAAAEQQSPLLDFVESCDSNNNGYIDLVDFIHKFESDLTHQHTRQP